MFNIHYVERDQETVVKTRHQLSVIKDYIIETGLTSKRLN